VQLSDKKRFISTQHQIKSKKPLISHRMDDDQDVEIKKSQQFERVNEKFSCERECMINKQSPLLLDCLLLTIDSYNRLIMQLNEYTAERVC
jgi:hypothetical protein